MANPTCKNPRCDRRAETLLTGERDDYWVFQCPCCKAVQVRTKPPVQARARMEAQMGRQLERAKEAKEWEARRLYFT